MIDLKVKIENDMPHVKDAVEKAAFRNMGHAAASLAKDAKSTIHTAPKEQRSGSKRKGGKRVRRARHAASPPGTPPYTQRGTLKRAIVYQVAADKMSAVIGATANIVGQSARAHEFGGAYKGEDYPARPFMEPALERAIPRFAGDWRGSIGE